MLSSLLLYLIHVLLSVSRHPSLRLSFPENTTLAPPDSHLDDLDTRKKKQTNKLFSSDSKKWCKFSRWDYSPVAPFPAITLRSLHPKEWGRDGHKRLSWAWRSRCKQVGEEHSEEMPCTKTYRNATERGVTGLREWLESTTRWETHARLRGEGRGNLGQAVRTLDSLLRNLDFYPIIQLIFYLF